MCVKIHQKLLVVLYVAAGLVFATNSVDADNFLSELTQQFKAITTKLVKSFLRIELLFHNDGSIFLSQKMYVDKILYRFNMQDCKPVATPIDVGWSKGNVSNDSVGNV